MQIIRAEHLGMCFGVRDAIDLAVDTARAEPLTVLGSLVHNAEVLAALTRRGIRSVDDPARVPTRTAMITAHGASERLLAEARGLGLNLIEATCPLVDVAHKAVRTLVAGGYHPVIIGRTGHVEVRGLTEDLERVDVILEDEDVLRLTPHARFGVAAQTTQPIERVRHLVAMIRSRFPQSEVRFIDTVCRPTKERQSAASDLARRSDVVIVIGGANSNNTSELVTTCRKHCGRVHHVQNEGDLQSEWFRVSDIVGITAGTSTPDEVIDRVERSIRMLATCAPVDAAKSDAAANESRRTNPGRTNR
ncbi:MAG TPA: 4-hydroxy-3-methylbut-2-enyl diphosphate reductase [Vicinamibacterales bacterium]|jgi:4-hydroxy-3-methylbut-2-enyl diphosphate reductase|nr:4-hydroxy-3-methylbut-2-enyl diphosphate reductase [Vicinamibacterales bacterium]